MKDVRDIVRRYLVKNGHDGLCSEDCWCRVDGLMPCDDTTADCQPARAWHCPLCDSPLAKLVELFSSALMATVYLQIRRVT